MPLSVLLDFYTVEPSGLSVPPFFGPYVRQAWSALLKARPENELFYLTIDDVRWARNHRRPHVSPPQSDRLTYSLTKNADDALDLLQRADVVVIIAGDAVPSVHVHAVNGGLDDLDAVAKLITERADVVLLGPVLGYAEFAQRPFSKRVRATHLQTLSSRTMFSSTSVPALYDELRADRTGLDRLVSQFGWTPIAELELYRGCTRQIYCGFCNEPVKSPGVAHRPVPDVLDEAVDLYRAGVRHFRLGQQACFFSYQDRDVTAIERLLDGIRSACPELSVLHIDNVDALAAASPNGRRIAQLVSQYCTEGNCAPLGVESFDPKVVVANDLTCTEEIAVRAIANINDAGVTRGPLGFPSLLPGLNFIYGLRGESDATHARNLDGLERILEAGYLCHRTNIRAVLVVPKTPLSIATDLPALSSDIFQARKMEIERRYDVPMKRRVYPVGHVLKDLHSFFVTNDGTYFRRLGSYALQVLVKEQMHPLYQPADVRVTDHAGRYVFGECA